MVTSIARQSVIIKCNMQKSVLTGNYEYYYAAGLAAKLAGLAISDEIRPEELADWVAEQLAGIQTEDERERHLYGMLKGYSPAAEYDGQMKELLLAGMDEQRVWEVQEA